MHGFDPTQVFRQLPVDLLEFGLFLIRKQVPAAVVLHLFQFDQLVDTAADDIEICEQAAQPTLIDITAFGLDGVVLDDVLRLFLGAHQQDVLPFLRHLADKRDGLLENLHSLLQVDDVDPVPLPEYKLFHLGIPPLGLVTKVDACL